MPEQKNKTIDITVQLKPECNPVNLSFLAYEDTTVNDIKIQILGTLQARFHSSSQTSSSITLDILFDLLKISYNGRQLSEADKVYFLSRGSKIQLNGDIQQRAENGYNTHNNNNSVQRIQFFIPLLSRLATSDIVEIIKDKQVMECNTRHSALN